jgi:hypothetical protein
MFRRHAQGLLLLFVLASLTCRAHAQYELPNEIFQRTILIRSGNEQATAFKFDQGGRIYLVTTRHFGKHLPLKNAVIQVWHNRMGSDLQSWSELPTVRTLFPAAKDVNLAVLETNEQLGRPYAVVKSSEVLTTGQKVWLMGWPFAINLPTTPTNIRGAGPQGFPDIVPPLKIGTISAINPTRPDSFEIQFPGSLDPREAAGPIVYWSPVHRDYEILGVTKRDERGAVDPQAPNGPKKTVKSGTVLGYSIDVVVDTISANPPS